MAADPVIVGLRFPRPVKMQQTGQADIEILGTELCPPASQPCLKRYILWNCWELAMNA